MARRITDIGPAGVGGKERTLGTTYSGEEVRRMATKPGARVGRSVLRRIPGAAATARRLGAPKEAVEGAMKGGTGFSVLARKGGGGGRAGT